MSKETISKMVGRLKQVENFPQWWKSEALPIPYFDNEKLTVTFMDFEPEQDNTFIDEADEALTNFLNLKTAERYSISELAYRNCMNSLDAIKSDEANEALRQITNKNDIWNFIQPIEIYVARRPYKEQDIYIMIACECEWEQEHGLQLIFRQGKKLTRISDQDGHLTEADAFNKEDTEDELLSKF